MRIFFVLFVVTGLLGCQKNSPGEGAKKEAPATPEHFNVLDEKPSSTSGWKLPASNTTDSDQGVRINLVPRALFSVDGSYPGNLCFGDNIGIEREGLSLPSNASTFEVTFSMDRVPTHMGSILSFYLEEAERGDGEVRGSTKTFELANVGLDRKDRQYIRYATEGGFSWQGRHTVRLVAEAEFLDLYLDGTRVNGWTNAQFYKGQLTPKATLSLGLSQESRPYWGKEPKTEEGLLAACREDYLAATIERVRISTESLRPRK